MSAANLLGEVQCLTRHSLRSLRRCAHPSRTLRVLSTTSGPSPPNPIPWFVDPSESTPSLYRTRAPPPHMKMPARQLTPLPSAIPASHPLARLHADLRTSPHLEPGTLLVCAPIQTAPGPALPESLPRGRRRRGRTYAGEGLPVPEGGGIWEWIVIAQVKEGTENRGAIESVMRVVRKSLLTFDPPLPLPPNSKRRVSDGWAMVDVGEFAVHIVSKEAREKFFPERRDW